MIPARSHSVALAGLAVGLLAGAFLLHEQHNLNHDVASFLYAARLMLEGGTLYQDFIDHNLPLASQSLIPVMWLSDRAGLPVSWALSLYVFAWAVPCWLLCLAMLRRWDNRFATSVFATVALLVGFLYLPGYSIGQREHMLTLLASPYLFVLVARIAGTAVPVRLAVLAGLLAGFGVGLKPHHAAIFLAMELVLLVQRRSIRTLIRPETVAATAIVAACAAHVLLLHSVWLGDIVPRTAETYGAYNDFTTVTILLVGFLLPAVLLAFRSGPESPPLAAARELLLAAVLGGVIVYASQAKGWLHHSYPLVFFDYLLLCLALSRLRLTALWARLRIAVAILLMAALAWLYSGGFGREHWDEMALRLRATPGPIIVLSTSSFPAFPVTVLENRRLGTRFVNLQLLPAIVNAAGIADHPATKWEPFLRDALVEDIGHWQPVLIFVPDEDTALEGLPEGFDVLGWFLQDAGFAAEWQNYRAAGRADDFLVYERM